MNPRNKSRKWNIYIPISNAMPGPKILFFSVLPLSIFTSKLWPSIIGILVLLFPWQNIKLSRKKVLICIVFSTFAGIFTFLISFMILNNSFNINLLIGIKTLLTIFLLYLCAIRYESSINTIDLLHLISRIGGSRIFAIPLISAFRFADLLSTSWTEATTSLAARGLFDKGKVRSLITWAGTGSLVTFFDNFFRRVDSLALTFDLRFGIDKPIKVKIKRGNRIFNMLLLILSLCYVIWVFFPK